MDFCRLRDSIQLPDDFTAVPATLECLSLRLCPLSWVCKADSGIFYETAWWEGGRSGGWLGKKWLMQSSLLSKCCKRNKSKSWLLSLGILEWFWLIMSLSRVGGSQNSESAGKEKNEGKKKKKDREGQSEGEEIKRDREGKTSVI